MSTRRYALAAALAILLLTACGGVGSTTTDATSEADSEAEAPAGEASESPAWSTAAGAAAVAVADASLGQILVDGEGRSLYLSTNDTGTERTCYDNCAATWPPLTTEGDASAGDGADTALLGTTARIDGTTQVTYNGHPLYYFGSDAAPGDVNGQGVGDVWFAVTPAGEAVPA